MCLMLHQIGAFPNTSSFSGCSNYPFVDLGAIAGITMFIEGWLEVAIILHYEGEIDKSVIKSCYFEIRCSNHPHGLLPITILCNC